MSYFSNEPSIKNINTEVYKPSAIEIDPMCNVILYTSSNCRLCRAAEKTLDILKVRYCKKDINASKINLETYDKLKAGKVCGPIAVIGDKILKGYSYKYSQNRYKKAVDKLRQTL